MEIQWYPGHMAKTLRIIKEHLKLVEIVLEMLDARIPLSSSNPELGKMIPPGKRLIAMNKADLADPEKTKVWIEHYRRLGLSSVSLNSIDERGIDGLLKEIRVMGDAQRQKWEARGRIQKTIRVMIVGIPNVGKSSLINRLSRKSSAKTGNKPGVTKSKQWIKVDKDIMLLDTPGILWPKFEDRETGINLAITGAIKEEIIDMEEIAVKMIEKILRIDEQRLTGLYGIEKTWEDATDLFKQIGIKRGCLLAGGRVDTLRAARIVLEDYRLGRMGRITLETPESIGSS
ncbi:MAG: Ribosome biogenesis GTPase A [Firmicutes bacterium]|nr:Ribosome biogenesis GTPase A [Bacillota bacterium]